LCLGTFLQEYNKIRAKSVYQTSRGEIDLGRI
jgi:hypothetical protein